MDFNSAEIKEYPEAYRRVAIDQDLEPGTVLISGELVPLFDIQYNQLTEIFVKIGAEPIRKAS